jgi:hypothetical protein
MSASSSFGVVSAVSAEKKLLTAADEIAWRPAEASLLPPRTRSYVNPESGMYVCVCMYIYVHTYIHVYTDTHTHTHTHTHTYTPLK